jgi:hypothetical protein
MRNKAVSRRSKIVAPRQRPGDKLYSAGEPQQEQTHHRGHRVRREELTSTMSVEPTPQSPLPLETLTRTLLLSSGLSSRRVTIIPEASSQSGHRRGKTKASRTGFISNESALATDCRPTYKTECCILTPTQEHPKRGPGGRSKSRKDRRSDESHPTALPLVFPRGVDGSRMGSVASAASAPGAAGVARGTL